MSFEFLQLLDLQNASSQRNLQLEIVTRWVEFQNGLDGADLSGSQVDCVVSHW